MKTKLKSAVLNTMLFAIIGAVVYAAQTYTYKCNKCGLILTFDKVQGGNQMRCTKPNCDGYMSLQSK
jgi:DNA-directed RNA polymerase subunit RPC12/RpoP